MPKPTEGMKEEAQRGLDWRDEFGRGGTEVGIARARDIVNDRDLSEETIGRMVNFFARHEVDKEAEGFRPGEEGYPSNGRIAWALWGGDPGQAWANKEYAKIKADKSEAQIEEGRPYPNEHAARLRDPSRYVGFRRDNDAGGSGIDFIYGLLEDGGSELQAIRFDKERFTAAQARQWLRENNFSPIMFEEATGERHMYGEVAIEQEDGADGAVELEGAAPAVEADQEDDAAAEEAAPVVEDGDRKSVVSLEHRSGALDARVMDEKKRTVNIAVSSELPVERSFGGEILDHSEGSIDLEFLASGRAPLLLDHDMEKQIGVIESVSLDGDKVLRAKVRFGRSALAEEVFQDVVDGIRANVSVGYRVNKMERDSVVKDAYRVKSWSPMEVSVVSIPADPSVGVGRSAVAAEPTIHIEPQIKKEDTMSDFDIEAVKAEAAAAAARNAADIIALGAKHNARDLADAAVRSGKSIEQFRGELLDVIGNKPLENQDIGLTRKEVGQFSLVRAIRALANPTDRAAQAAARFELEASEAAARAYGTTAQGIMIPADVLGNWKRDLNTSDDNEIVATNLLAGEFIDVLRNASSVMQAGARMMPGLVGNVAIPKKTAASAGAWISSEGGAAGESEPTFGTVSMTPKTVGAFTDMTRQLILQSTPAVEQLVRDDLTQALALAIDAGALKGSGSSGQPTGIYSTSGINTDSFAGATPTWAEVVGLETLVAEDNALLGNLAYILPASLYGTLKTTVKDSGSGQFVVSPDGTMNGYRTIVSNQATAGYCLFGNFSDVMIGMFGGLDLTVDPYTSSNTGTVRVVALQSVDVAVRHAVSFALGTPAA